MLDSQDVDSQIASLYALLNLGIGNDAWEFQILSILIFWLILMLFFVNFYFCG
jgi:hypothetical protein